MKHQRLLGFLWLALLLGAAVFCILWGRVPTKGTQAYLGAEPTMYVVAIEITADATPRLTALPIPTPAPTPVPTETPDPAPFTFFWYSDTQYYAYKRPEIFRAMTSWSVEHAKEYGIPGLRLGYLTACAALAERIGLQRQPWAVNTLAQEAGLFLLRHRGDYVLPVEELLEERQRMAAALQQLGVVEVWPSDTHILLCRLRMGNAASLKEYLAERCGLLIRDAGNFEGLDERFFRIAVQSVDEDDALLRGIGEWMSL